MLLVATDLHLCSSLSVLDGSPTERSWYGWNTGFSPAEFVLSDSCIAYEYQQVGHTFLEFVPSDSQRADTVDSNEARATQC